LAEEKTTSGHEDLPTRQSTIIVDTPAKEDAFGGGGHVRTAGALAQAIVQLDETDGAIGLEGKWGAGKSTVIEIAQQELASPDHDEEHIIFTFDLWAHQTDDFRRAFLEEFIEWAGNKKFITPTQTENAKDHIRDRIKTIKQDNSKQYSWLGVVFIALLPLMPIVYTWLSPFAFKNADPVTLFDIPIYVHALGFVVLIYVLFLGKLFSLKRSSRGERLLKLVSRTVSMFSKETEQETITQNIRESDPTTVEFHSIFRRILGLAQNNKRRIVFVLDNIDRLPKEAVRPIWSEVRALFSSGSPKSQNLNNSYVTAVVPYDKQFVCDAFRHQGTDNEKIDIFEKTFHRILRVSPPIFTDWQDFLYQKLDESFSSPLEVKQKLRLYRLLSEYLRVKSIHVTPRSIINYVNNISCLWGMWGREVPIESIALFSFYKDTIEKDPEKLLQNDLVDHVYIKRGGIKDWQKDFAALWFNIAPDEAYQILLENPIRNALGSQTADELIELSSSRGFGSILLNVIDERTAVWEEDGSDELLGNAARNINALKNIENTVLENAWLRLGDALKSINKINFHNKDNTKSLCLIAEHAEKRPELRDILVASCVSTKEENDESSDRFEDGQLWLNALLLIIDIRDKPSAEDIKHFVKNITLPEDAEFTIGVAYECSSKDVQVQLEYLNVIAPASDIVTLLQADIELVTDSFIDTYRQTSYLFSVENKAQLLEKIVVQLKQKDKKQQSTNELFNSFHCLYEEISDQKIRTKLLKSLANDGTLAWHSYQARQNELHMVEASSIWLSLLATNTSTCPNVPDQHPILGDLTQNIRPFYTNMTSANDHSHETIKAIAEYIASYNKFSQWMKYAIEESSNHSFFKDTIKEVIQQKKFSSINTEDSVTQYPKIKNILGEELTQDFLIKCAEWKECFEKTLNEELLPDIPMELIEDVVALDNKDLSTITKTIDNYLRNRSQEDWKTAVSEENNDIKLLIDRQKYGGIKLQPNIFVDVLKDHALRVLKNSCKLEQYQENWHYVVNAIETASLRRVAENIFKELADIATTSDGVCNFIQYYSVILPYLPYEKYKDLALDSIFSNVLSNENDISYTFIDDNINEIKTSLSDCSDYSKQRIEEVLRVMENNPNSKERAYELRQKLDLPSSEVEGSEEAEIVEEEAVS
jgi:hypothetical protein